MRAQDFTTFINAAFDPNIERNFDKLAASATRSFNTVQNQAKIASAAVAGLVGGRGSAGLGGGTSRGLQQQANAARLVARDSQAAAAAAARAATSTARQGVEASKAAVHNAAFAKSLQASATALNVVQGPLGPLAGRVRAVSAAITELTGVRLGLAGAGAALFAFARAANTVSEVSGRLRPLTTSQRDFNATLADVVGIANRARASLDPVVGLYVRLTQVGRDFGISQARVSRVVETAAKAATLSGGPPESREAALLQFGQALGSNFSSAGQEMASIREQAFVLAQAIARGLKNADGTIGTTVAHLKELQMNGELTTEKVVDALERSSAFIDAMTEKLPRNLSTSFREFGNNIGVMIGQTDRAIGVTSGLANIISLLAQNLRYVAAIAIGVGVSFATIKLSRQIADVVQFRQAVRALDEETIAYWTMQKENAEEDVARRTARLALLQAEREQLTAQIPLLSAAATAAQERAAAPGLRFSAGPAGERAAQQEAIVATQNLTAAKARLATVEDGVILTERRLAIATEQEALATENAGIASTRFARAQALMSTVGRGLVALFTSWNFWLVAITATLFLVTTRTSSTERILSTLNDTQLDAINRTLGLASANTTLAESYRTIAREMAAKDVREARSTLRENTQEFAGRLRGVAGLAEEHAGELRPATDADKKAFKQLRDLADAIDAGTVSVAQAYNRFNALKNSNKEIAGAANARQPGLFGIIGGKPSEADQALDNVRANMAAQQKLDEALAEQTRVHAEITNQRGAGGKTPQVTATQLQAQAIAGAIDQGSMTIRAAGARRRDALDQLDQEMGVKQGKVPLDKVDEYRRRATAIEQQYNTEVQGVKEAAKAKADAARAEREAARQNQQIHVRDARDEAEDRMNTALLALERRRATMTQAEYNAERVKILAVYDQEIEKVTATASASNRASRQMIADAKAVALEAQRSGEKRTGILDQYATDTPAEAKALSQVRDLQRMVGTAVNGIAFIGKTADEIEAIKNINPLGTGIYTKEMAAADAAHINEGVRKPLRDVLDAHERELQVNNLILQGREAEAAALKTKLDMEDRGIKVRDDEYAQLLRNAQQEEEMNILLARRERIVGLIQGSVDDARQAVETFFLELPKKGPKAAGDLVQSMITRVQQIEVRQVVEKLFAGADEKVKALVSSRYAVENASRTFASQISSAASNTVTLGDAARTTAQIMVQAANDIQAGVQAALSGGGAAGPAASTPAGAAASIATNVVSQLSAIPKIKSGVTLGGGIGASVIAAALPGAVITDNIRTAAQQNAYIRAGLTNVPASRDPHVISDNAFDVRLPKGMSFADAARALKQVAPTFGAELAKAFDETSSGGTGKHGHFVIIPTGGRATARGASTSRMTDLASTVASLGPDIAGTGMGGGSNSLFDELFADMMGPTGKSGPGAGALAALNLGGNAAGVPGQITNVRTAPQFGSAKDYFNAMGSVVGGKIDTALGTKFFKGIGGSFGTALEGAGQGAIASGFAKALGIKQSAMGAQIGGAIGSFLPIPGGALIGGLIGGTLGGMLKKPKAGASTVSVDSFGNVVSGKATGNDAASRANASSEASSVADALQSIAKQLGGTITAGGTVTLGYRSSDKKQPYRVDPSGAGRSTGSGVLAFATQEEQVQAAVKIMLEKGVVGGISAASQKILQSGQDLQKALEKATVIESIPKRLMQLQDPVRYAVTELNREFADMISYLKEGGATAEQFADAQKLYDMERADAITQAQKQAVGAIDDMLKEMLTGSSSPLNKRTVYGNAQAGLDKFVGDINSGKIVDQTALTSAAKNFEDASRTLNGSSQDFFNDFDMVVGLLTKARDNAGVVDSSLATDLPASPFATESAVQDAIKAASGDQVGAINSMSDTIADKLDTLIGLFGGGGAGSGSTIDNLPGFGGGVLRTFTDKMLSA